MRTFIAFALLFSLAAASPYRIILYDDYGIQGNDLEVLNPLGASYIVEGNECRDIPEFDNRASSVYVDYHCAMLFAVSSTARLRKSLQDRNCSGKTRQVVKHMIRWEYNLNDINDDVSSVGPCSGE